MLIYRNVQLGAEMQVLVLNLAWNRDLEIPCSYVHMGWQGWGVSFWVHSSSRGVRKNRNRVCSTGRGHRCEEVESQVGESTHPKKAHWVSCSASQLANLKPEMKSQKLWLPFDILRNKSLFSWTVWELWLYERLLNADTDKSSQTTQFMSQKHIPDFLKMLTEKSAHK